eukprot:SAG11_NODE_13722_length_642_cov_1.228361_1_plen_48_part_10
MSDPEKKKKKKKKSKSGSEGPGDAQAAGDFAIKPQSTVPKLDTSEWPL